VRLSQLEPQWLRWEGPGFDTFRRIDDKANANGIIFVCPKCFAENGNKRPGVHSVICWAPGVPQEVFPNPGRWELVGTSFEDLTLRAGSSSILLTGPGCQAHFFITDGEIR
jgi:hypothetical protein